MKNLPAVDIHDVSVTNGPPEVKYVKVGYVEPPKGRMVKVSFKDRELLDYFKNTAAVMGANTVALTNSALRYKSGAHSGTKVELLLVSDEGGTHGGDELGAGDDVVPMNVTEDGVRLY